MNRRELLVGSTMLFAVAFAPASVAHDLETDLATLDNAIDTTRLSMNVRWGRIWMLGFDPRIVKTFEEIRTYARDKEPNWLFARARLLVAMRDQVVNKHGVAAVANAMDWRTPTGLPGITFWQFMRHTHITACPPYWSTLRCTPFDDVYYGNIRPS